MSIAKHYFIYLAPRAWCKVEAIETKKLPCAYKAPKVGCGVLWALARSLRQPQSIERGALFVGTKARASLVMPRLPAPTSL